jgi:hypothetical protein
MAPSWLVENVGVGTGARSQPGWWAGVSAGSCRRSVIAEFDVEVGRVEARHPVPRGQAAPGVVDHGEDPGEQALPLQPPIGEVADGRALEVVELVQEAGPPRLGLGRGVGVLSSSSPRAT